MLPPSCSPPFSPVPCGIAEESVDLFDRLDAEVSTELAQAYAPRSSGPLGTAVRSLAAFARRVPNRVLFKLPRFRGDLRVEGHNEWTLCLWAWDLGREKSKKTKRYLKAKSIEQRISLAKGLLSHRYGFQLAGEAPRLKSLLARMRSKDPLGNTRKKRRGLRRRHLREAWDKHAPLRAASRAARSDWAALTIAWHVLARGGELASITRRDIQFRRTSDGRRYAIVWVRPLKKKRGQAQAKEPQFVAELVGEEWEPYKALRRLAEMVSVQDAALFTERSSGRPMRTAYFRALVKRIAKLLGFDPKLFGAHSARIGGATDLVASGRASQMLLEAKGRWGSDIATIYARMTRRAHLAASDLMHGARGRDLEELLPEYVQPA